MRGTRRRCAGPNRLRGGICVAGSSRKQAPNVSGESPLPGLPRQVPRVLKAKASRGAISPRRVSFTAHLAQSTAQQGFVHALRAHDWVVYAQRPFAGSQQVLDYLRRCTHRVAISNHRLLGFDDAEVRFRYRDYAHGNRQKVMALEAAEFLRRFCLQVLPAGFMRIRHHGNLANRNKRAKLAAARAALDAPTPAPQAQVQSPESLEAFCLRIAQRDIHLCALCRNGRLVLTGALPRRPRGLVRSAQPP
ncbi:MAG: transposase [Burkholderiales bacterium]